MQACYPLKYEHIIFRFCGTSITNTTLYLSPMYIQTHHRGGYFAMLAYLGNKLLQDIKIRFVTTTKKRQHKTTTAITARWTHDIRSIRTTNWFIWNGISNWRETEDDIVSDLGCTVALHTFAITNSTFVHLVLVMPIFTEHNLYNGLFLMLQINHKMNSKDNVKIGKKIVTFGEEGPAVAR